MLSDFFQIKLQEHETTYHFLQIKFEVHVMVKKFLQIALQVHEMSPGFLLRWVKVHIRPYIFVQGGFHVQTHSSKSPLCEFC
jgi:hypothetical protein